MLDRFVMLGLNDAQRRILTLAARGECRCVNGDLSDEQVADRPHFLALLKRGLMAGSYISSCGRAHSLITEMGKFVLEIDEMCRSGKAVNGGI